MADPKLVQQGIEVRERIMAFLREYHAENGLSPTVREIGTACDIKHASNVRQHLKVLMDAGDIRIVPKAARGIVLVKRRASRSR